MGSTIITPITDRTEIAYYAEKLFKKNGKAVEIGVWEGAFSAHNLKEWSSQYYMVDAWGARVDRKGVINDKNHLLPEQWDEVKRKAINVTRFAEHRRTMIQANSIDAAKMFTANTFDWIYLDAMHNYESVKEDIKAWWPKLRSGGLMSGDDYGSYVDYERISAQAFHDKCSPFAKIYKWGVIQAVNEFCKENNLQHHVTWMNDKNNPAWYFIKP